MTRPCPSCGRALPAPVWAAIREVTGQDASCAACHGREIADAPDVNLGYAS